MASIKRKSQKNSKTKTGSDKKKIIKDQEKVKDKKRGRIDMKLELLNAASQWKEGNLKKTQRALIDTARKESRTDEEFKRKRKKIKNFSKKIQKYDKDNLKKTLNEFKKKKKEIEKKA